MTSLEKHAKRLGEEEMIHLQYRMQEGIASDDEAVLFRIFRMDIPEADARRNLKEYRDSFFAHWARGNE